MPQFVIDCERMKYPNTGLYTYCSGLGHALTSQIANGEQLYFYIPPHLKNYFGPEAGYLPQHTWHKFFMPYRQRFDIWHTCTQLSDYAPPNRKVKRVLTIHDLNFLYESNHVHKKDKLLAGVQRIVDQTDHLVVISAYVKDDVLRHLNTGNKPVSVIYNGTGVKTFPGFDTPVYRPRRPFLFTVGTVLPKKNFHVIPCLLAHQDYDLVIAGKINPAYKERILQEAESYGVRDRVKIIGPVKEEDKYWYLEHCSAFIFPSVAEGFGLPVIEAMYFGKPVFLSNRTSLPEIGGNLAYYFEDFDPAYMQGVFESGMRHYRQYQPADAIRQHAAGFSWENTARQYLEIYRSLLG